MTFEAYEERMSALEVDMQESKLNQELAMQRAQKDLHARLKKIKADMEHAIAEARLLYRNQLHEARSAGAEQRRELWKLMRRLEYEWKQEHGYGINPSKEDREKGGEV